MADFGGALLDLADCFVLPVSSGVLKVTLIFVEMVSTAAGVRRFIWNFKLNHT